MSAAAQTASSLATPVGILRIAAQGDAIVAIDWVSGPPRTAGAGLLGEAERQLDAYFAGELRSFDLPLAPSGSTHDQAVWRVMTEIPYGEVRTYGEVAAALRSAARAVGTACGRNPIPVVIPCHRIVAAGGRLGGYSGRGGASTKRALLSLEGAAGQRDLFDIADVEAPPAAR